MRGGLKIKSRKMQPKFFGYLLFLFIFSAFSLVLTSSLDAKIIGDRTISYKYISTGFEHSCAIAEDGTTYCWGGAGRGQLGRGTGGSSEKIPVKVGVGEYGSAIPKEDTIIQISAGYYSTCAVTSSSKIYCWGANGTGQLGVNDYADRNVPREVNIGINGSEIPAGTKMEKIEMGNRGFVCALSTKKQLYCWGDNVGGKLGNGTTTSSKVPKKVKIGESGSEVPSGALVKDFSLGNDHACLIDYEDQVYCWGKNDKGQLGINSTTNSSVPKKVKVDNSGSELPNGVRIRKISTGATFSCAIASNSETYCWGENANGELANGSYTNSSVAKKILKGAIPFDESLVEIKSKGHASCGKTTSSGLYCWGSNYKNKLGHTNSGNSVIPTRVRGLASSPNDVRPTEIFGIGESFACSADYKEGLTCWGNNSTTGLLGYGSEDDHTAIPTKVSPIYAMQEIKQDVDAKFYKASKENNPTEQISDTTEIGQSFRLRAGFSNNADSKIYNASETCNRYLGSSKIYCRGARGIAFSGYQDLADGRDHILRVPRIFHYHDYRSNISGRTTLKNLSFDSETGCAVGTDNLVYCWGANSNGETGNDKDSEASFIDKVKIGTSGSEIPAGSTIKQVASGGNHSCAIASDNLVYCWGSGNRGALGNGASNDSNVPKKVKIGTSGSEIPAGSTIKQVASGGALSCAIASNNQAYCWGSSYLGNDTSDDSNVPKKVKIGTNGSEIPSNVTIKQISVSQMNACVIGSDDMAYCWGDNAEGSVGDGSTAVVTVPHKVVVGSLDSEMTSGLKFKKIISGKYHTCAIASDNLLYCWGGNSRGQLGINSVQHQTTPKKVKIGIDGSEIPSGSSIKDFSVGEAFACAVTTNNLIYCWGIDYVSGQVGTKVPKKLETGTNGSEFTGNVELKGIYSGGLATCALDVNNKLVCWGQNNYWLISYDDDYSPYTPINKNPVLTSTGGSELPSTEYIKDIKMSVNGACVIATDNNAYCWGMLWQTAGWNRTMPKKIKIGTDGSEIPAGRKIYKIFESDNIFCLLDSNGDAYCLGSTDFRGTLLGNNTTDSSDVPKKIKIGTDGSDIPSDEKIEQISVGQAQTCALTSDKWVYCWGESESSGTGMSSGRYMVPKRIVNGDIDPDESLDKVVSSLNGACTLSNKGKVYCWGKGEYGALGTGNTNDSLSPKAIKVGTSGSEIPSGTKIKDLFAFGYGYCVLDENNVFYCWGANYDGQLGIGNTSNQTVAKKVKFGTAGSNIPSGSIIKDVSKNTSSNSICILTEKDVQYCSGKIVDSRELSSPHMTSVFVENLPIDYIESNISSILPNSQKYVLTYAKKEQGVSSCSLVPQTSYSNVTSDSEISWDSSTSSAPHGLDISYSGYETKPVGSEVGKAGIRSYSYQTTIKPSGPDYSFTNTKSINSKQYALFDFQLRDNRKNGDKATYCFKIKPLDKTYSTALGNKVHPSTMDDYLLIPAITTKQGYLSTKTLKHDLTPLYDGDISTNPQVNPLTNYTISTNQTTNQTETYVAGSSNPSQGNYIEIDNKLSNTGFSMSIAPNTAYYNKETTTNTYVPSNTLGNNSALTAKATTDSRGRLKLTTKDTSSIQAIGNDLSTSHNQCTNQGISIPTNNNTPFIPGTADSISILNASSTSSYGCKYRLNYLKLSQTIPTPITSGKYQLNLTVTLMRN